MPRREQPLGAGDEVLLEFARDLRQLREKAGGPTYRELSQRAHYSAAALSEAASGRKLPSLAVTVAYVGACDGDVAEWEARWRAIAADITAANAQEPLASEGGRAPYVGLAAFEADDADLFFGRDRLKTTLLTKVRGRRFTGVFGASGSGKSSLLRAGLAAALMPECPVAVFTPGPHPIEECAVRLAAFVNASPAALRAEFIADPENLQLRIRQAFAERPADADLVLIVDQFEEVFTLCADPDERAWLINALTAAAAAPTSRVRVVLGVRADFYGHCGQYPDLVDALQDAQVLVGPMSSNELRQAITEPALRLDCRVETALVSELIAVSANEPGVLPLISHALRETWRRRRGTTLTLAGYEATGGVLHALAHTAEEIYAAFDERQQGIARQIFLRLTALGDGTVDTKRRIGPDELDTDPDTDPNTVAVLDRLTAARLVTVDQDSVELTHEALIRHWPRLRDWLTEDREGHRIHRELSEATQTWESLHRDPGALYRGTRLGRTQDWAATRGDDLNAREREFLDASVSAQDRERTASATRGRRLRRLVVLLTVLLLVASAATGYAISSSRNAAKQRNAALAQTALREASAIRATNPALALQLTLAAYRLDPTPAARDSMHELFAAPYATRLTGHTGDVYGVAVSVDGTLLATAAPVGGARTRLWDISDPHRPRELPPLPAVAAAVAFSPKGNLLATASSGMTPRLWDLADPENPRELTTGVADVPDPYLITALAFSPNGSVLATAGSDRTTRLWDLADPRNPRQLATLPDTSQGGPGLGASVAFSRDGHTFAATTHDQRAGLWDLTDPGQPRSLGVVSATGVLTVALSPDGHTLATGGRDSITRLWNLSAPRGPELLAPLTGHTDAVVAVAFSDDGTSLATASGDRRTRLWDVTDPRAPGELASLTGHTDIVRALAFGPGGHTLATASGDGSARLEDISAHVFASHTKSVLTATFSPDGHTLATSGADGTVRLWNVADHDRPVRIATVRPGDDAVSVAFSLDGTILATTGINGTVQLWTVSDQRAVATIPANGITTLVVGDDHRLVAVTSPANGPSQLWTMSGPAGPRDLISLDIAANLAAFSRDGRRLATAGADGVTQLWDLADPHQPRRTGTLNAEAAPMAFSHDGRLLAAEHPDGTTRLWDVADLAQPHELGAVTGGAGKAAGPGTKVAFSPDGRHLAIAGSDRTARLWNIADPRHPTEEAALRGHAADVVAVAFSPDGNTVATAGSDHVVRLWDVDVERIAAHVCALAHPRITPAEWEQHLPGLNYQPPCP